MKFGVEKIISGHQHGADCGAIDMAMKHHIPHMGYVPKGRRTEDGPLDEKYTHVIETKSAAYPERTEMNVRTGSVTVVFSKNMGRGSRLTADLCEKFHKPWIQLEAFPNVEADAAKLKAFLESQSKAPKIINVAGSRESKSPGMHDHVIKVLEAVMLDGQ